jgi:hypothetical protein
MVSSRRCILLASLVLVFGLARAAVGADGPSLALTGRIILPDGSPASGATVTVRAGSAESPVSVQTDRNGRFRLSGEFLDDVRLHARSADGAQQTTRLIPVWDVRSVAAAPIELKLEPAIAFDVTVVADRRPVEGASVGALGMASRVQGRTDRDGKVRLLLPASDRIVGLVGWHAKLGVNGNQYADGLPANRAARLVLLPPAPLRIRAVDPEGRPVRRLKLAPLFFAEGAGWAASGKLEEAVAETDADGTATLGWAPLERLKFVDFEIRGSDWKFVRTDLRQLDKRLVTAHVCRRIQVEGKLGIPFGQSPENLLITGYGFGLDHSGDIPAARARADGSFTLHVPAGYSYLLRVADREWASDPWAGLILSSESSKPAAILLPLLRATPVRVRVTQGNPPTPVGSIRVNVDEVDTVSRVDNRGKVQQLATGVRLWLFTDEHGEVETGLGPGSYLVNVQEGRWRGKQRITVSADQPMTIALHRPWNGPRQLTVRLLADGQPYAASPNLVARAWVEQPGGRPETLQPRSVADGSFEVQFDAASVSLFFSDPAHRRSVFREVGVLDPSPTLNMEPMARYAGVLLDARGLPLARQELRLMFKNGAREPAGATRTDAEGRFQFNSVPTNVPLVLRNRPSRNPASDHPVFADRIFEAGEVRQADVVRAGRPVSAPAVEPNRPRLAARITDSYHAAGISRMRALVVMPGDTSDASAALAGQILDANRDPTISAYLPLVVDAAERTTEAATLKQQDWPVPQPKEIVLAVLAGDGATIATTRIAVVPQSSALSATTAFLKQHAPPRRDAVALLTAARDEARKTNRRVWVVHGGPRCPPCFRLGRWIDDHHQTLERDFVIAKVMHSLDARAEDVIKQLHMPEADGIPWHAFTEPDGTILATSHGPLGNIGFPSTFEGRRHFRRMLERSARRLTPADIDGLMESLSKNP